MMRDRLSFPDQHSPQQGGRRKSVDPAEAAQREILVAEWLRNRSSFYASRSRSERAQDHTLIASSDRPPIFHGKVAKIIREKLDSPTGTVLQLVGGSCVAPDQLRDALNKGYIGVWEWSAESANLRACAVTRRAFGRSENDLFTWSDVLSAVHPEDRARWSHAAQFVFRTGSDYRGEFHVILPDRSERWLDLSIQTIADSSGRVLSFVGLCVDVTAGRVADLVARSKAAELSAPDVERRVEQRMSEFMQEAAEREAARDQMQQLQRMETIGQLTGGVAHDFNNLLSAVMGNLDMLRRRLPDDPRLSRLVDGAMMGVERGATLTQRLLAYSRKQALDTGPVDVREMFTRVRGVLESYLGPDLKLEITVEDDLPFAFADAPQLELAVLNLVLNARDAMDAGTIEIEAARVVAEDDQADTPPSFIEIAVRDTGIGMPAHVIERACDPFFSTKPLGQGSGLGLSMVHGLASQLGGKLTLTSEVDRGTVATLRLPVAHAVERIKQDRRPAKRRTKGADILVVDDDPLVASVTIGMLQDLGYRVFSARSGEEAFRVLRSDQSLDLMLTDYSMPGMNGMELASLSMSVRPDLPVLLATGFADTPAGMHHQLPRLSKPYDIRQLQQRLHELLGEPIMGRSARLA